MNVKTLAGNFASFLTHHSGELRLAASVMETVVSHLPIDQQDKARLLSAIDTLQTSAGNVAAGAAALSEAANAVAGDHAEATEVVVSKEDVQEAVHNELQAEGVIPHAGE